MIQCLISDLICTYIDEDTFVYSCQILFKGLRHDLNSICSYFIFPFLVSRMQMVNIGIVNGSEKLMNVLRRIDIV